MIIILKVKEMLINSLVISLKSSYFRRKKTISNTDKIDKIVLNPVLAYPLFLGILYIIFKFTFNWVGTPLADHIDALLNDSLIPYLGTLLNTAPWFRSLLLDGIVAGVGSVIVFLPVILTLFWVYPFRR